MRDLIFRFGTEDVAIRIHEKKVWFCKLQGGFFKYTSLKGLRLSIAGILKEFPELKDKEEGEIKEIAIQRFQEHINKLNSEDEIQEYLKNDLKKHGYVLKYITRKGFRKKVIN